MVGHPVPLVYGQGVALMWPLSLIQKIVGGVALSVILALSIALFFADRKADKWERQAVKCNATLQRISTAKDEQKAETGRNIDSAKERIVYVDRIVRPLETRPLPENCVTPDASEWGNIL
jgi:hypothetical protein